MTVSSLFTTYWPFIATIIGWVVSIFVLWTKLNTKVQDLKSDVTEHARSLAKLEGRVDTMQPDLGTIKTDIAVMKNTLEFIKGAIAQTSTIVTNNK